MDTNTAIVLVVVLVAVIAIVFLFVFRTKGKMSMRGPFNTRLEMNGSNAPAPSEPGVRAEDVTSEKGGLTARDEGGQGVHVKKVRTQKDVNLTNAPPPGGQAPKA